MNKHQQDFVHSHYHSEAPPLWREKGRGLTEESEMRWMKSCLDGYDTKAIMYTWCKKEENGKCGDAVKVRTIFTISNLIQIVIGDDTH